MPVFLSTAALLLLMAQEGLPPAPPRMATDDTPSAMACTFVSFLRGDQCFFEAASGPAERRDTSESAARAGSHECAVESRGDDGLRKECERAVAEVSLGDLCALHSRLVDAQGRLTRESAACAESLREAIGRTSRAAALSLSCCSCLEQSHCAVNTNQCRRELGESKPGPQLNACMARSCSNACGFNQGSEATVPAPRQRHSSALPDEPDKT
jgi:hypothetical protein